MKKSTTFTKLVQTLLTEEDVKQILQELKYEDTASKFTASQLPTILYARCLRTVGQLSAWCRKSGH
jgi:hypothetical protein